VPAAGEEDFRLELVRPRMIQLLCQTRVIRAGSDEGGAPAGRLVCLRDISREEELSQMKSEFLSTAAHELRTPMASIYGYAELLLNQEFPPEVQRELLQTIYRQSELIASIINELLDLARIEARRGKDFNYERIEVGALLKEAVSAYKPPEERAGPDLAASQLCWVIGDARKLTQAVSNVLSNAYKYSTAPAPVGIDLVEAKGEGGAVRVGIRIADRGIGMTEEQMGHLFERFYRADTSGKVPGTGLGMSIVKEIIDLHGGEVTVESTFGEGSRVTLWLPLEEGVEADSGQIRL
jgi:signal transduction histidine kinase